ncbi:reticulocyte binding protein homologue 1 (RH1), partial [Plasmodium ovale curtisi]
GETPGIFIVLSGFATSDLSVDFCDARQGGGAYGKTPATRPFYGSWPFAGLLLTCSFLRYPLILWITVLPPLSELIPLAAAERPSAASHWHDRFPDWKAGSERNAINETAMTMITPSYLGDTIEYSSFEEHIKQILQKIYDKKESLKKIILLKDEAQLDITLLDDLIQKQTQTQTQTQKQTLIQNNETIQLISGQEDKHESNPFNHIQTYIQQKDTQNKNIQNLLKSLYNGNINTFIDTISKYILKQKDIELTQHVYTDEKINDYLEEIKNEQNKIDKTIDDIKIQETLKQITHIVNNIKTIKKDLLKEFIQHLIKYMNERYQNMQQGYNNLTNYINQYEEENNNMKQYITTIRNIQKIYYDNIYAKEKEIRSGQYYKDFITSRKNIYNIRENISKNVDMIKNEEKKKIQNCVDKYNSIKQYVKMFKNGDTQDENNNNNNDIYDKLIVPSLHA